MADKVTLDFENNRIIWDNEAQQGEEFCPDLAERKQAILAAMGYETIDFSPAVKILNAFANGEITQEEMVKRLDEFERE